MNTALMIRTMRFIADHQEQWSQVTFGSRYQLAHGCNTTYCFAGWAVILDGWEVKWRRSHLYWVMDELTKGDMTRDARNIDVLAQELLGLTEERADSIFYSFTSSVQKLAQQVGYVIGMDPFGPEADKILAASSKEDSRD